ncbi:MAG: GIDE domain-containing protein [Crocinitomicaceae bacterium]
MLYIIGGAIFVLIGVSLFFGSKKQASKSLAISATDETSPRNLFENYESLSNSYGKGSFKLYSKLYGKAHSENPIISEYSKKECAYVYVEIEREFEQLETKTESNGAKTQKWVKKTEVVLDREQVADDFSIKKDEWSVKLNHRDAEIDAIESYSVFEKEAYQNQIDFSFAGISFKNTSTNKTIGFYHVEKSIPVGQSLFVVGNANDDTGELIISKSTEKNKPYIISTKNESEVTADYSSSSRSKKNWGYGLLMAGVVLFVIGILKKLEMI